MKTPIITSFLTKRFTGHIITFIRKNSTMSSTNDILFQDVGDKGIITLNRPKSLNAASLSMVSQLYSQLLQWESKKSLIIVKGVPGKAYCSGGDIREVGITGKRGENIKGAANFFKHVYLTDGLLGSYKVPCISLIDGIIMGGGVGMAVLSPYRVATERAFFALPETQVGLFPDAAASYYLPRLRGKMGWLLGLTGYRLKGSDVVKAGIATHFVESKNLEDLEKDLLKCSDTGSIDDTLKKYSSKGTEFSLDPMMEQINHYFSDNSVENVIERLTQDGSKFAREIQNLLEKMSPTSLKITMKALENGSKMTLEECLQMEYRIVNRILANHDLYEGVRALLIDKDKKPKWDPPTLPQVTPSMVDSYFIKLPQNEELNFKVSKL